MSPQNWAIYHGPECTHRACRAETKRIARRSVPGREPVPRQVREAVVARDGLMCTLCGRGVVRRSFREPYQPDTLHLDHVEQYAHGGSHAVENLRVACADCNLRRSRK